MIAARHDRAGYGDAFAQHAAGHVSDREFTGLDLALTELDCVVVMLRTRRGLFIMGFERPRCAVPQHRRQQPNPYHYKYPVTGVVARASPTVFQGISNGRVDALRQREHARPKAARTLKREVA
jgi:hypothetical protein